MGPGVVLAALAIGSGELVLTPRSGAQYGFALLWVPILTIVYKAAFSEGLARLTIASMLIGISPRFSDKLKSYRITMGAYLTIMAVTILLGDNQPGAIINMVAAMNAVVFGLLGFALLYLDRKLPTYAQSHPAWRCIVSAGSAIFLGVAFMKLF